MKGIQKAGVKLGKIIIEIISAQIIKYLTSEELKMYKTRDSILRSFVFNPCSLIY